MTRDIEIPITTSSYLGLSIVYGSRVGVVSTVAAELYVNGTLLASARVDVGRISGHVICIQESRKDVSDMPTSPSHMQPFDLDMGDACFHLDRCAADRVCSFLAERRIPFHDFRKLTAVFEYLPANDSGSNCS
jgi:hypothetical protein